MKYTAPIKDMLLTLKAVSDVEEHVDEDTLGAVLQEAARLAGDVWAPTNHVGDRQHSELKGNDIKSPDGFKDAYQQFAQGGWGSILVNEQYGGQNLPWAVGVAVNEMWQSANLSLSLCTFLTETAIEAITKHGDDAQKEFYIPKLSSGEWTATMLLTEPQAGSDLSIITTHAKKHGDGYLLKGQKSFATWGDNDFSENIVHLVLANIDGMSKGYGGMGLFIVPKFLEDGSRNDIKAVELEEKMGLHASPTCTMVIGDDSDGAVGYLLGEAGKGLRNMFTMMNVARVFVGLQGVAVSERAYQNALLYAKEREQKGAIINHPDVKRMLLTMKANIAASRALVYYTSSLMDSEGSTRLDFLTPLIKVWASDLAIENTSLAVQVHGGAGFIEDSRASQYYRDARVLAIYEGANGILASDFMFRKVIRNKGREAKIFMDEIKTFDGELSASLNEAVDVLEKTTEWIISSKSREVAAAAVPYLDMFATVLGGYMLLKTKQTDIAEFYMGAILPKVYGLSKSIMGGYSKVIEITGEKI